MGAKKSQPGGGQPWDGVFRRQVGVTVRSVDEKTRSVRVICSSETEDSHGDVVEQDFVLDRYRKNPVVLWAHNAFDGMFGGCDPEDLIPIGRATDVEIVDGNLEATIVFATAKVTPLAEQIYQGFLEQIIRAVSIGFRPGEIVEELMPGGGTRFRLRKNHLYELSCVPIPSNPDAVAKSISREHDWINKEYFKRGAVGFHEYPAKDFANWDSDAAMKRVQQWASKDGSGDPDKIEWSRLVDCFAWYKSAEPLTADSFKLLHHDVVDGSLVTVKEGVLAAGNAIQGNRASTGIPTEDVPKVKQHLEKHYKQFDITAPWHKSADIVTDYLQGKPLDDVAKTEVNKEIQKVLEGTKTLSPSDEGGQSSTSKKENNMDLEQLKAALATKNAEYATLSAQNTLAEERLKAETTARSTAEASVKTLTDSLETEKKASAKLDTELKTASDRASKAESELITLSIEGFVGTKITPAEKDEHITLASEIGLARVKSILSKRADLTMTTPVVDSEGKPVGGNLPVTSSETPIVSASAELASMATKAADARVN